jgi:hypothetical protein
MKKSLHKIFGIMASSCFAALWLGAATMATYNGFKLSWVHGVGTLLFCLAIAFGFAYVLTKD